MSAMNEPFPDEFQGGAARLLSELQAAWQILSGLSEELYQSSLPLRESVKFNGTLAETHAWYEEKTWQLLGFPVNQFLRQLPIERTLQAMQSCDREIDAKSIRARSRIDDGFQRLLARVALDLCEPWRIWRGGNHAKEWNAWDERRIRHSKHAAKLLDQYERWVARSVAVESVEQREDLTEKWWREQRAVTATLQMEVAFRDLTLAWFETTERLTNDIYQERREIQSNAAATLGWMEEDGTPEPKDAPSPISVEERLRMWAAPVVSAAAERLPEQVEILSAGVQLHGRSVPAQAHFLKTFQSYAREPMHAIVEQFWAASAKVVREVWQAKEIVEYWRHSPESSGESNEFVDEARHNAIVILREQLQHEPDPGELDARAVEAFWIWEEKGSLDFEAEEFGWPALLRRPRGRAVLDTAAQRGQSKAKASAQRVGQWTSGKVDKALEFISGKVPEQPTMEPVIRRTTLRDTLALPAAKTTLPILYRLLFRLTPVEDRRFLMGRDQELAGLRQAAEDWESGRFAACLMIGARGSGKTSLLNCAVEDVFTGKKTIRAEFDERILSPEQMNAFLRRLLGMEADGDVEAAFHAEQRIIILEESERLFLRRVGGFAAAHYLMHLIHRTSPTTLWIVVMNDKAFRVLDAAAELHRVFSHRINAMNVSRADLENAILERHRLSGMRLKFIPPPAGDPRVSRVKQWIGIEESAQKLFFDSLYQQSEGIFRSAFELWLSSIQRAEGETLTIRQPLDPAFGRFRSELAQEDQFTLLVIQEHGSLTRDELMQVLEEPHDLSASRMERLTSLGLIEPDPRHPGSRVRPEAQRFVNDLLRRTNLT